MYCPVCRADYPEDWKVCPKDETTLLHSAQIGKYKIAGLLGVGGMGAVYRAINPDTHSKVAIKIMNPAVASSDSARARFQREAAAVAALRTGHVVKVFDFGADQGTLYLVMELLDGHTLRDEIQPAPQLMDLARVHMVIDGALKGLAAAHKAGIVHRDLKPENIYVAETDDGEVPKLLDFGIARVRTKDSDLTLTGSLMGTAGYMAIEQVAPEHGEIGPWTDVYAMGAILYEMLCGAAACSGETVTAVLQKVLRHDIAPLEELRPGLPAAVYALVARCLDVDPTERPADAEAMRTALAAARLVAPGTEVPPSAVVPKAATSQVGLLATAPSKDTLPSKPPTIEDPPRPKRPPVALVAIAVVVVLASAAFGLRRMLRSSSVTPDAAVIAIQDPPVATDAGVVDIPIPAVPPPPEGMIHLPAGEYPIGETTPGSPDSMVPGPAPIADIWVDKKEMTLGELRRALASPSAGGVRGDALDLPARNVTFAEAEKACAALGKRLPNELEWEAAASTTPHDPARATLLRGKPALVPSTGLDCTAAGLCDMLGSVLEWTSSDGKPGERRVRGASFMVSPTAGWQATIHFRVAVVEGRRDAEVGVRCVKDTGAP